MAGWNADVGGTFDSRGQIFLPEYLDTQVNEAQHRASGHFGRRRILREFRGLFLFSHNFFVDKEVVAATRQCKVCHKCNAESSSLREAVRVTHIIDQLMISSGLEIFKMPLVQWTGGEYDGFALCFDQLKGWTVANPPLKLGPNGEIGAHLLIDGSWGSCVFQQ